MKTNEAHKSERKACTEWEIEFYISIPPQDTVKRVLIISACLGPKYIPQHSEYFLLYLIPLRS